MKLTKVQMAALSGPALPMFALMMPLVVFVPPFYAEHMGLGMAAVGIIFTVGRLFDSASDPVAGYFMDKTRAVCPKHVWIVIGAVPLALATWNIFFVEAPADTATLMVWLLVLYVGYTLMNVGTFSWASEVATDYHERSQIMGAVQMANGIGTIIVLSVPAVLELTVGGEDISALRIQAMGATILLLLPITLSVAWIYGPRPEVKPAESEAPLWPALKHAFANPSLRRLIIADLALGLNTGSFTALSVFFVEIVLAMEGRAGILQLLVLLSSLVGLPIFIHLAGRIEKHVTLCIAAACTVVGAFLVSILPAESLSLAVICYLLLGFSFGGQQMLPRSIMSDVLEENSLKTGDQNTGLYFSFLSTTFKLGLGLGVGVTYLLASAGGFDPALARESDASHWVIRTLIGGLPILYGVIVIAMMWKFPLDRQRQEEIRREMTPVTSETT